MTGPGRRSKPRAKATERNVMPHPIRIIVESLVFDGELNDTKTAARVHSALPLEAKVNRWGDEIYFGIPVKGDAGEPGRTEMTAGDLAFWPPGHAFCIFWGRTPASEGDEPRAASEVVPIARLVGDVRRLSETHDRQSIRVERAD